MHLLNRYCQYKAYKNDKSNFIFKRWFLPSLLRPMLSSVGGLAISSGGYFHSKFLASPERCMCEKEVIRTACASLIDQCGGAPGAQ